MKKLATLSIVALVALTMIACGTVTANGNASHYRLLSDPDALRTYQVLDVPQTFHVTASSQNGSLNWSTKVEGHGKLCAEGTDVPTLNDGAIRKVGDPKITGPYIVGCAAANGVFTPSNVEVVSGPQSATPAATK